MYLYVITTTTSKSQSINTNIPICMLCYVNLSKAHMRLISFHINTNTNAILTPLFINTIINYSHRKIIYIILHI
jgi:hypothetical protein